MADVEALVLRMSADLRKYEKSMDRAREVTERRLNEVERRALQSQKTLSRTMGQAGDGMVAALRRSLAGVAPVLAAAFSTQAVIQYADAYTSLKNRLKATGLEGRALQRVEDGLYEAANRNGVAVAATAELYQRAAMARENLGATEADLMRIVSGTSAALKLQGTSATEASGALLQLGQLLGGNMVQAQEYNSLIDQLPIVLEAVAKGSDRWGGSVNKLTRDVKDGKVTVQEWATAMLKGFAEVEARAGAATPTVGAALQTLNNQLGRYVGQADQSLSATQRMAQGIQALANNLDTIVPVATALTVLIGGRYALAMTVAGVQTGIAAVNSLRYQAALIGLMARQTGATTAQVALNAALTANPIGLVVTLVAALAAGLYLLTTRYTTTAMAARELDRVTSAADTAIRTYAQAVDEARAASGKEREELLKKAAALREVTEARIADARVAARRQMTEAEAAERTARRSQSEADRSAASYGEGGFSEGRSAMMGGSAAAAAGAAENARRARREANEAWQAVEKMEADLARADNGTPANRNAAPAGDDKKGSKKSDADRVARLRADLAAEEALNRARATGDAATIRAAEERQELARLQRQYEEAGYEDARSRAREQLALLNQATQAAEAREAAEKNIAEILREKDVAAEKEAERERTLNDQLLDRLGYAAELARLQGSPQAIRARERELWIEERINELLRLRLAWNRDDARAMASGEWAELDMAETAGEFRNELVSGLRAALDGELSGFFEGLADRFSNRMLERLADDLMDVLGGAFKGLSSGGGGLGWLGSVASLLTGGRKAATGRAGVTAGYPILTGERRPEVFVPKTSGTILPRVDAAVAQAGRAASARAVQVTFAPTYNVEGSGPDIAALRAQMARDKAEFPAIAIQAVTEGQQRRAARMGGGVF